MDWVILGGYLVAITFCLYMSGRFSGSETALTALDKIDISKMKKEGKKHTEKVEYLKEHMDQTITAILIGNNVVNVAAPTLVTVMVKDFIGNWAVSIASGILTLILLIVGEITPKGFSLKNKKRFSLNNAALIYYMSIVLRPLIKALNDISDYFINVFGGETKIDDLHVTESEVKHLASMLEEEGVIKKIEKDILQRVFYFGDQKVKEVKVSKEDTYAMDADISIEEAAEFIREHGFTRIPVTKHDSDEVVGILYSKEILGTGGGEVKDYMREPYFVRNKDDVTKIFQHMRKERIHLAVVRDGDGDFDGIITLEDILEELVGEIYDEFD
ncbi:MAG: hemolysin family protein [Candidatus Thermoplasmatota archaeon]